MGYAVCYRDATGATQVEDAVSLEAALEQVESRRNAEGVTDVRVFREVPIEVRTYYKVVALEEDGERSSGAGARSSPSDEARGVEPPPGAMPIVPPPAITRREPPAAEADGVREQANDDGRRTSLFNRG